MPREPIIHPELRPPAIPERLPAEERFRLWAEATDAAEALLLAGLRHEIGPEGDIDEAYRHWNRARMDEHEQMLIRMLERLTRAEEGRSG